MEYKIIASGSDGNAVLYDNSILVDCGVPYLAIEKHINDIKIVLLTHQHLDHLNIKTLVKLSYERPGIRIACCSWMREHLTEITNKIDVYHIGVNYDYGGFIISPVKLYHNVQNCGYRITIGDYKILHATDTNSLEGITAKDYDLFAIEHNYNEDTINDSIESSITNGQYSYQKESIKNHLSEQAAGDFIFKNRKDSSQILRLHESKNS